MIEYAICKKDVDPCFCADIFIDQAKELREPTFHVLPASLRIYRLDMTWHIENDIFHRGDTDMGA